MKTDYQALKVIFFLTALAALGLVVIYLITMFWRAILIFLLICSAITLPFMLYKMYRDEKKLKAGGIRSYNHKSYHYDMDITHFVDYSIFSKVCDN